MNTPNRTTIIDINSTIFIGDKIKGTVALDSIVVTDALVGLCVIIGFTNSSGGSSPIILPIGTPPGEFEYYGAVCDFSPLSILITNGLDANKVSIIWHYGKL